MKNIYKILIGVAVACVLMVALDWAVGTWSEKMYYKSKYGMFHRQIYCLQESKDDILILGSSRAAHHYVPQIFEDSLGMSCYNAGSDGECIYYHCAILASRIFRGVPPKMVLYEVMESDAVVSSSASFSLDAALERLAPHYGEVPEIDSLFYLNGWKERVKLRSKTYRYNSKLVQTIKCNYIPWPEDRGYEALNKSMPDTAKVAEGKYSEGDIEEEKLEYLNKLINTCKEHNIALVFFRSPSFSSGGSLGVDTIKTIANEKDVLFLDYVNDSTFMHPEFFQDNIHLNDVGAREYSKRVVVELKSGMPVL